MSDEQNNRVYLETANGRKNYIKSVGNNQILFGEKDQALNFSQKDANILKQMLINSLGNGHIESAST